MSRSNAKKLRQEKYLELINNGAEQASKLTPEEMQFHYKGMLVPTVFCSEEMFRALESFEAREDDVLITTYPKCGTHWAIQLLHEMLLEAHHQEPSTEQAMLELGKPDKFEIMNGEPSPRVLSSHLTYNKLPKSFVEKKTKILLILRNPKDTAVSYFHFSNAHPMLPNYATWDGFFKDFMVGNVIFGSYFDYTVEWDKHIDNGDILAITFEDMKVDLPAQMRKISDFYGLSLSDEQLKLVQGRTTFSSMKEKSSDVHGILGDTFFRKGEFGDWRHHFTEEQSKEMDEMFEKKLAGTKLGKIINYAKYCSL